MEKKTMRVGDTLSLKDQGTGTEMEAFILDIFVLEIKQTQRAFLLVATDDRTEKANVFETFFLEYDAKQNSLVRILSKEFNDQLNAIYREGSKATEQNKNNQ